MSQNNNKKLILIVVVVLLIGIFTVLGSFALWTYSIGNNIEVAFNTLDLNNYINYTPGKAIFAGDLETGTVYTDGTSSVFKINKTLDAPYNFYASFNLKINSIGDDLTHSRMLKWAVTSKQTGSADSEQLIASSDFVGTKSGDVITLIPNIQLQTISYDYKFYIWVDVNDPYVSLAEGENLDIELWMDVYQEEPLKIFNGYCYNDGTNIKCNVLDSEKLFNRYGLSDRYSIEPNSYTNISSSQFWTSISVPVTNNVVSIYFKTSDDRIKDVYISNSIYRRVEYIETNGTQYINTGYVIKTKPRIEAEVMLTSTADKDIIGNESAINGCLIIDYNDVSKRLYYRYGKSSSTTISYATSIVNVWINIVWGEDVYHDVTKIGTASTGWDFSVNFQPLYIGRGRNYGYAKFKEVKIYDNDILVRDLIPVYRIIDEVAGMYDTVNEVFYTNAGTGVFETGTAGNNI